MSIIREAPPPKYCDFLKMPNYLRWRCWFQECKRVVDWYWGVPCRRCGLCFCTLHELPLNHKCQASIVLRPTLSILFHQHLKLIAASKSQFSIMSVFGIKRPTISAAREMRELLQAERLRRMKEALLQKERRQREIDSKKKLESEEEEKRGEEEGTSGAKEADEGASGAKEVEEKQQECNRNEGEQDNEEEEDEEEKADRMKKERALYDFLVMRMKEDEDKQIELAENNQGKKKDKKKGKRKDKKDAKKDKKQNKKEGKKEDKKQEKKEEKKEEQENMKVDKKEGKNDDKKEDKKNRKNEEKEDKQDDENEDKKEDEKEDDKNDAKTNVPIEPTNPIKSEEKIITIELKYLTKIDGYPEFIRRKFEIKVPATYEQKEKMGKNEALIAKTD